MSALLNPPGLRLRDEPSVRWTSFTRVIRDPEASWPRQILEHPIIVGRSGARSLALVADPEAVGMILTGPEHRFPRWRIYERVVGAGAGRQNLSVAEGDQWRRLRRVLSPIFRPDRVTAAVPIFRDLAERAMRGWLDQGGEIRLNAGTEMTAITLQAVWRVLFAAVSAAPEDSMVEAAARRIGEARLRGDLSVGPVVIQELAARSLERPAVAGAGPDNPFTCSGRIDLTPAELNDNARLLLSAGYETTSVALTWALWLIGQAPEVQRKAQAEIDAVVGASPIGGEHIDRLTYTGQVLQEVLRLYPVPAMARQAGEPVTICGEDLPAGSILVICLYALHRHRRWWGDPDAFQPDRFAAGGTEPAHRFAYLPFSAGRHACIGSALGWAEAVVVFATILRAFEVTTDTSVEVRPHAAITLRPGGGTPVVLRRR